MPCVQLTYIPIKEIGAQRLVRRTLLEKEKFPCEIEISPAGVLFSLECNDDKITLVPRKNVPIKLNGKQIEGKSPLVPGNTLEVGGYAIDFHFRHEARPISLASKILSISAKIGVGLFLVAEVLMMAGLATLLSSKPLFQGTADKQKLSYTIVQLKKRADNVRPFGSLETTMLSMLKNDIDKRIEYMGDFGDSLSPRQRRNMNADLERLEKMVARLEENTPILPPEEIDIEKQVKKLIK